MSDEQTVTEREIEESASAEASQETAESGAVEATPPGAVCVGASSSPACSEGSCDEEA